MTRFALAATLFLVVTPAVCLTGRAEAAVYHLHLVTDNGPDYTDIRSFARSATERWEGPRDLTGEFDIHEYRSLPGFSVPPYAPPELCPTRMERFWRGKNQAVESSSHY